MLAARPDMRDKKMMNCKCACEREREKENFSLSLGVSNMLCELDRQTEKGANSTQVTLCTLSPKTRALAGLSPVG